jgi:hypothetical protein
MAQKIMEISGKHSSQSAIRLLYELARIQRISDPESRKWRAWKKKHDQRAEFG